MESLNRHANCWVSIADCQLLIADYFNISSDSAFLPSIDQHSTLDHHIHVYGKYIFSYKKAFQRHMYIRTNAHGLWYPFYLDICYV